jgi:glyoxylase-like metal-dependent hydrolase (beta-lactamase superfamily II)
VSVHRDAAGILVDPSRLVRSATISYGDAMDTLWGKIVPVEVGRIDPVSPGDILPGMSLRAIATPGHTATHLGYFDTGTGVLFTGDAAHARLPGSTVIVPTLSPVEVDIDAWRTTADTLQEMAPSALALPHFGLVDGAAVHLERIEERIDSRMRIAAGIVRSPDDGNALAQALANVTRREYEAEGGDVETKVATMELCMPSWLGAQGILRWYKVHGKFRQA